MDVVDRLKKLAKDLVAGGTVDASLALQDGEGTLRLRVRMGQYSLDDVRDRISDFQRTIYKVARALKQVPVNRLDDRDWISVSRDIVVLNAELKFSVGNALRDEENKVLLISAIQDIAALRGRW